jgi:lipoprotein-releasing system permease protein
VIGVAIGVAALNVVLSVMNGFDADLKSGFVGANAHITVMGYRNQLLTDYEHVAATIRGMEHVVSVGPYIEQQALLRSRERAVGVMVWGIDPDAPEAVSDLNKYLWDVKATALKPPPTDGSGRPERIFLGARLAQHLGVTTGDDLILFLPILQQTPLGMMPKSVKFQVVGLFSTGMFDYDEGYTYVSIQNSQKMFQLENQATGVAIKVDNVDLAPQVAQAIREKFSGRYLVQDWLQLNHSYMVAVVTEEWCMGIILSLIVLVAALNVVNPLTMMVIEKTKEIGILKAMGSSNSSVSSIFMIQGIFIGAMGTLIGLLLGFILCWAIAYLKIPMPGGGAVYTVDYLPVKVQPLICYAIVPSVSMMLCFFATLYPARNAAKMEPVDAIRLG